MNPIIRVLGIVTVCTPAAFAHNPSVHVRLMPGSSFISEHCLAPCACPIHGFETRLTGWVSIRLVSIGDVTDFYEVTGTHFYTQQPNDTFDLTGPGTYRRMDPISTHGITLDLTPIGPGVLSFEGDFQPSTGPLPRLNIRATSPKVVCSRYTLNVVGDERCHADYDDGSDTGSPDGGVTIDDLIYYLALFEAGDGLADLDDGTGTGTQDSGVTIDDMTYFLRHFEAGC